MSFKQCEACDAHWPKMYETPWCDCHLCQLCMEGIVNSCPVCHAGRIVPLTPGGGPFPWQPFAVLGALALALWMMA